MEEILHQPGFLGTSANFAADMTLVMSLLVAATLSAGFWLARAHKYQAHRWFQSSAAALNLILVLWLMVLPYRDFILPGVPGRLSERFYAVTTLHGIVGSLALVFGVFVALRGNELVPRPLKFNNYKRYMRISYALYLIATLLGIWVYFTWFVNNPNPPIYQ
jgi:uncharacterized membrane protein YozB (DUF420 family)